MSPKPDTAFARVREMIERERDDYVGSIERVAEMAQYDMAAHYEVRRQECQRLLVKLDTVEQLAASEVGGSE